MNSFDVETALRRFAILGVGGLVVIGVLWFITRSAQPSHQEVLGGATGPAKSAASGTNLLRSKATAAARLLAARRAGGRATNNPVEPSVGTGLPAQTTDADPSDGPTRTATAPGEGASGALNRPVRLLLLDASQSVWAGYGALFPKQNVRVQVRHLSKESGVQWVGIPRRDNDISYRMMDETTYFSGRLSLGGCQLTIRNGQLSVAGQLSHPVLLSFGSSAPQSRVLLWPVGMQASIPAQCDKDGVIAVLGGLQLLELFACTMDRNSNAAVSLWLRADWGACATNVPVQGDTYKLDCIVTGRERAEEARRVLDGQLATVAAFKKVFQAGRGVGGTSLFWQMLDEQCQWITQGRLGLTSYNFGGSDSERELARQAVLADLAVARGLASETKRIVEAALTVTNLDTLAALSPRLAWEMNLAQMTSELAARSSKVRPADSLAGPEITGQFRYCPTGEGPARQPVILAQLDFSLRQPTPSLRPLSPKPAGSLRSPEQGRRAAAVDPRLPELDAAIAALERRLSTSRLSAAGESQLEAQIDGLKQRRKAITQEGAAANYGPSSRTGPTKAKSGN